MTSLVVVSAGLSTPSSTRLLADGLTAATVAVMGEVEVTHIELRDLAHQLTDHLLTGFPGQELAAAGGAHDSTVYAEGDAVTGSSDRDGVQA